MVIPPGPTPPALDKHFDFLDWSPDGEKLLIGTSDLTSRSWGGSVWIFNNVECQEDGWSPQAGKCLVGAQLDCGVNVGRFLRSSDKFIIGCDSGSVQILGTKSIPGAQETIQIQGHASLSEHNDVVLDIDDLGGDGLHFVSCSEDKCIKIWDLESFVATHTFAPAHARSVTSVRTRPSEAQNFASCSRDGSALLWDPREEFPASSLVCSSGIALTSLSWANEMTVVVGGVDGQLNAIDIRNTSQSQSKIQLSKRPVHSMKSKSSKGGPVAVCQDNSKISVLDFGGESPVEIFTNDSHGDFVRGLSWNQKHASLWSCGWDSKIFSHHVATITNGVA